MQPTILVVDDEAMVLRVADRMLGKAGCIVLLAASGEEALHLCRTYDGSIQLALVDLVMPGLDGPALVERLYPLQPAIRIVFMSGYSLTYLTGRGLAVEAKDFIRKPFMEKALLQRVAQELNTIRSRSAGE
jgi:CheY-like chemotaxis protein